MTGRHLAKPRRPPWWRGWRRWPWEDIVLALLTTAFIGMAGAIIALTLGWTP